MSKYWEFPQGNMRIAKSTVKTCKISNVSTIKISNKLMTTSHIPEWITLKRLIIEKFYENLNAWDSCILVVQMLEKIAIFFKKLIIYSPYDPEIPLLDICLRWINTQIYKNYLYVKILYSQLPKTISWPSAGNEQANKNDINWGMPP